MKKLVGFLIILVAVVALLPLAVVFLRPNLIIPKAKAKEELSLPSSHFINWRGAELHYTDEGTGYPVLLVHGFGGSLRNFSKLDDSLRNEYRVLRVDLPGFGLSDFPEMGKHPQYVQMYRDYISFILDTLHLDSVYVVGNSMGGGIAWLAAADHPDKVRKLVLLNSAGYDVSNVSGKLTMFRFKSVGHVFDKGMPVFMSESGLKKCYSDPTKANPDTWVLNNHFTNREGNIQNMLALARSQQFPDTNIIKQVQCPTLVIWGKQDHIIPVEHAKKFKRDIKNCTVLLFDSCGHVPMQERPGATTAALRSFFAE
ncbi:MAG TPA: alpha/beta hydrolase [Chitinophagales bacterium]|nr:alpha/beta hydrolase [Chitinophagales bacterium]